MKQLSSDVGDLRKTSSVCPFCNKTFKILGEHPQYCKERKGRPYADFLAVSSGNQSIATKPMASPPVQVYVPIVISRKICAITGHTNLVWFHQVQRNHGESHTTGLSRKWKRWRISWNEILEMQKRNAPKEELAECAKSYHQDCWKRPMIEVMRGMQRVPERSSITISGSLRKTF